MTGLPTIETILTELDFLDYSTQKRNLAYRIQFVEFLKRQYSSQTLYGAVKTMFIKNFHDLVVNTAEQLLFICVEQELYLKTGKRAGITESLTKQELRKVACNLGVIAEETAEILKKVFGKRDVLHPSRQLKLDTEVFTDRDMEKCIESLERTLADARAYFQK